MKKNTLDFSYLRYYIIPQKLSCYQPRTPASQHLPPKKFLNWSLEPYKLDGVLCWKFGTPKFFTPHPLIPPGNFVGSSSATDGRLDLWFVTWPIIFDQRLRLQSRITAFARRWLRVVESSGGGWVGWLKPRHLGGGMETSTSKYPTENVWATKNHPKITLKFHYTGWFLGILVIFIMVW